MAAGGCQVGVPCRVLLTDCPNTIFTKKRLSPDFFDKLSSLIMTQLFCYLIYGRSARNALSALARCLPSSSPSLSDREGASDGGFPNRI